MTTTASKPTMKDLRAEAQRLGITAESAGCPIEELLRTARDNDDPLGYLTIHAPEPAVAASSHSAMGALGEIGPITPIAPINPISELPPSADPLAPVEPSLVEIRVPLSLLSFVGCFVSGHVEVRMTFQQGVALRRLQSGLDAQGAKLQNGRRVSSPPDAIRWLLEQITTNH